MRADNAKEIATFNRKQLAQARLAVWHGRKAFIDGKDGIRDNPHDGWQNTELKQHGFQCLLWARFLLGWLREFYRE